MVALVTGGAGVASGASMGDLAAQARAVGITPGAGGAAEEAAIDRLGRIALAFLDAVDAGAGGATAAYQAIVGPLERSHEAHRQALDRLSQRVVDEDGDMDALFASAAWREHQALATQSLYYLNWLYYQGAHLFDGAKRKELLRKAADGFGEFATAGGGSPLVIESHLGRGLANLELDQVAWAIADFEAVVSAKGAAPERVRKATLALADAYLRAGRSADALRASERALAAATPGDVPRARLSRARALLLAAASQPARRTAYQGEARALLDGLRGGPWGAQADRILRLGLDNPQVWAATAKAKPAPPPPSEWEETKRLVTAGKLTDAIPRLERVLASEDADDRAHRGEAQYLLGVARFKTGDLDRAATALDAALATRGNAYYRDDAAYLRFKIDEARYLAAASPETEAAYVAAIERLLRDFPDHKAAAEARFRLGGIYQRRERWADAIAQYAKVKGDPPFELQAAFATAQCATEQLDDVADERALDPAIRTTAEEALARFWGQIEGRPAADFRDAPVTEMKGRAALLSAYLAGLSEPPDYEEALRWLEGYEEAYPMLVAERPQVVRLRLAALTRLGRLEAAAVEAARPEAGELEPTFVDPLVKRLLTSAAREKARGHDAEASAGRRAARRLCERALASAEGDQADGVVRRRLRETLATLYEEAGETAPALAIYREILTAEPDAIRARMGAARVLEADGKSAEARALWDEILAAPPGRSGWLEAHYQSARLSAELGEPARACATLRAVPASMLANTAAPTSRKIQELVRTVCAS